MAKRAFDILAALAGLIVLAPVMAVIALAVRVDSPGPALHWSSRVGRYNRLFKMPKFRTMKTGAPNVATHLLTDPDAWITPLGRFLRRSSLDELPQLWSVLVGDMSLVGPRPALFNQDDLVALRTAAGVEALRPGVTGWAQINGRDDLPNAEKARLDADYLARGGLVFDIRIIVITLVAAFSGRGVRH
ncbi:MAG: lipid carrier--UDP-N-acetylgalactosaminyltransferase [Phenylobacterium sp.]|uniref:sugar transferase n=1 Tax=Phenylobacterium sp. TaxID=1871053 RepID=UPI0025E7750B|nr:sugar transferase [Phenylobacterium sp.]MBA4014036.1 lipid carrier--UDP-N-acetylgalactosaminyltransferase [Phenylobacterium sp.]